MQAPRDVEVAFAPRLAGRDSTQVMGPRLSASGDSDRLLDFSIVMCDLL